MESPRRDGLRGLLRVRRDPGDEAAKLPGVAAPAGPTRGREAIEADIAFVMDAMPDLVVEVLGAAYASDRRLWTEWRLTGTCGGDERWDRGRALEVVGVSVFRLSNSGFLEERLYWDSAFAG